MRWEFALRAFGIAGVVAAYLIWLRFGSSLTTLVVVLTTIAALVGPEVVDALPYGPTKGDE